MSLALIVAARNFLVRSIYRVMTMAILGAPVLANCEAVLSPVVVSKTVLVDVTTDGNDQSVMLPNALQVFSGYNVLCLRNEEFGVAFICGARRNNKASIGFGDAVFRFLHPSLSLRHGVLTIKRPREYLRIQRRGLPVIDHGVFDTNGLANNWIDQYGFGEHIRTYLPLSCLSRSESDPSTNDRCQGNNTGKQNIQKFFSGKPFFKGAYFTLLCLFSSRGLGLRSELLPATQKHLGLGYLRCCFCVYRLPCGLGSIVCINRAHPLYPC